MNWFWRLNSANARSPNGSVNSAPVKPLFRASKSLTRNSVTGIGAIGTSSTLSVSSRVGTAVVGVQVEPGGGSPAISGTFGFGRLMSGSQLICGTVNAAHETALRGSDPDRAPAGERRDAATHARLAVRRPGRT